MLKTNAISFLINIFLCFHVKINSIIFFPSKIIYQKFISMETKSQKEFVYKKKCAKMISLVAEFDSCILHNDVYFGIIHHLKFASTF